MKWTKNKFLCHLQVYPIPLTQKLLSGKTAPARLSAGKDPIIIFIPIIAKGINHPLIPPLHKTIIFPGVVHFKSSVPSLPRPDRSKPRKSCEFSSCLHLSPVLTVPH